MGDCRESHFGRTGKSHSSGGRSILSTAFRDSSADDAGVAEEQTYVTALHERLEEVRSHVARRLADALAAPAVNNPQAIGEREAAVRLHTQRLTSIDAADSGLCFGRLDRREADVPRYVGRIGLLAEDGAAEPLLSTGGRRRPSRSTRRPRHTTSASAAGGTSAPAAAAWWAWSTRCWTSPTRRRPAPS